MEHRTKNLKKGFTLFEITVVVSIIILLSTIFIASYRGGEKQFALKRSANQLAQSLRKAQEMAMAAQKTPPSFGSETFPKGGYGIYLHEGSASYVLFADCDNDGRYDESGPALSCAAATEGNPYGEKIEEFFLEEGITISNLSLKTPENSLYIVYFPPDPIIKINYDLDPDSDADSVSVSLNFEGGQPKTIYVNTVGLIDVD